MALGEDIGNQFLFDQVSLDPLSAQSSSIDGRTRGVGGPDLGKPLSGLEVTDAATQNYYNSWANLQNFAKSAWKNYGIDVTAPDLSDPIQQKMNQTFLKAVASTRNMGNALQRGRENQLMLAKAKLTDPDALGTERTGEFGQTVTDDFGSGRVTDVNELIGRQNARMVESRADYNKSLENIQQNIPALEEQLQNPDLSETERTQLQNQVDFLKSMSPTLRRPPQPRIDRFAQKRRAGRDQASTLNDVWNSARSGFNAGDREVLEEIIGGSGGNIVSADYETGINDDGQKYRAAVFTDKKGNKTSINLDDNEEGRRGLAQLGKRFLPSMKELNVDYVTQLPVNESDMPEDLNRVNEAALYVIKNLNANQGRNNPVDKTKAPKQINEDTKEVEWELINSGINEEGGVQATQLTDAINRVIDKGEPLTIEYNGKDVPIVDLEYQSPSNLAVPEWMGGKGFDHKIILTLDEGFEEETIELSYKDKTTQGVLESLVNKNINKLLPELRGLFQFQQEDESPIDPAATGQDDGSMVTSPDVEVKEVRRQTKDGRIAVYNPDTKEFIRYED